MFQVLHDWSMGFNNTKNDYATTLLESSCHKSSIINGTTTNYLNETFSEEKK